MKKTIPGILPVGAPWGGPESIRFVSCSSSLYMHLKRPDRFADELYCTRAEKLCDRCGKCRNYDWHRKMHEQVYHELLTLSGLNCQTLWDPEFRPEILSDLLLSAGSDEAIGRAMTFAGFEYQIVEGLPPEEMKRLLVESIDRGTPVAARNAAGKDWCLVTGYERGGERITGTYAPHAWEELETAEEHAFAKDGWIQENTRLLLVTDDCPARIPDYEEFAYLRQMLIDPGATDCVSGLAAFDRCIEFLRDDAFFAAADAETLQKSYIHLHEFIGLLAESRCFAAFAFFSGFYGKVRREDLTQLSRKVGSLFMETHNGCWKAWELLGGNHISRPEEHAPRLRDRALRLEVIERLQEFKQNDWNAVLLLEAMESRTAPDGE